MESEIRLSCISFCVHQILTQAPYIMLLYTILHMDLESDPLTSYTSLNHHYTCLVIPLAGQSVTTLQSCR